MAQLFINVIGHNTSGKTTISKKLVATFKLNRVNGDDLRELIKKEMPYFRDLDISYPNKKYSEINPLILEYRFELTMVLLKAGENVIYDGSGSTRDLRQICLKHIKTEFPNVTTVLIWTEATESDLLNRLKQRDRAESTRWEEQYTTIKKDRFEAPESDEATILLRYDQTNYDEIERRIGELLK